MKKRKNLRDSLWQVVSGLVCRFHRARGHTLTHIWFLCVWAESVLCCQHVFVHTLSVSERKRGGGGSWILTHWLQRDISWSWSGLQKLKHFNSFCFGSWGFSHAFLSPSFNINLKKKIHFQLHKFCILLHPKRPHNFSSYLQEKNYF